VTNVELPRFCLYPTDIGSAIGLFAQNFLSYALDLAAL
jgi:hypothetical protein